MSREAVRCGDCHHLWTVTESYVWVGDQKCPIYLADAKHPVILPKKHHFSKLVIAPIHNQVHRNLARRTTTEVLDCQWGRIN